MTLGDWYRQDEKLFFSIVIYKLRNKYLLFEEVSLLQGECVCLGDNRNDVHHFTQVSHKLNVNWPQTKTEKAAMQ